MAAPGPTLTLEVGGPPVLNPKKTKEWVLFVTEIANHVRAAGMALISTSTQGPNHEAPIFVRRKALDL